MIDDIGYHRSRLQQLLDLNLDLTYAVIPDQPSTRYSVEQIRDAGRTLFVHMPMEPQGYPDVNPGTCALLLSMTQQQMLQLLRKCVAMIPGAVGLNNHMGSRFSADVSSMTTVVNWVMDQGLLFLDSMTAPKSAGVDIFRRRHGYGLSRSVFLDNERDVALIGQQLDRAIAVATKRGHAIAIGHPYPQTIAAVAAAQQDGRLAQVAVVAVPTIAAKLAADARAGARVAAQLVQPTIAAPLTSTAQ